MHNWSRYKHQPVQTALQNSTGITHTHAYTLIFPINSSTWEKEICKHSKPHLEPHFNQASQLITHTSHLQSKTEHLPGKVLQFCLFCFRYCSDIALQRETVIETKQKRRDCHHLLACAGHSAKRFYTSYHNFKTSTTLRGQIY